MKLSYEQELVVKASLTDMIVIAGAGSGKTTVLIKRIQYLKEKNIDIKILAVTFTKKAQLEMKARLKDDSVDVMTFDALFYQYKSGDKSLFLSEDSPFEEQEVLSYYLYDINNHKGLKPKGYDIFNSYKANNNLIDYYELTNNYYKLLDANLVKQYDVILIDEFQDVNQSQLNIIYLLKKQRSVIFAVGDPDQSIYGFRGSFPNVIENFFHNTKASVYYLEDNYRSSVGIINYANYQISKNERKFNKQLKAVKTDNGEVLILKVSSYDKLFELIYHDYNINAFTSYAVLYRTHEVGYHIKQSIIYHELKIECLSVHEAKGLEFDCVYIIGVDENIFPSSRQLYKDGFEEERRLFYVGITRARSKLVITYFNKKSVFLK